MVSKEQYLQKMELEALLNNKTISTAKSTAQSQLDFELEFFGPIVDQSTKNSDVLRTHIDNLNATGDWKQAVALEKQLVELNPSDADVHYQLACSYSLMGLVEAAIGSLELAVKSGYTDREQIQEDPDLARIRKEERFIQLLENI